MHLQRFRSAMHCLRKCSLLILEVEVGRRDGCVRINLLLKDEQGTTLSWPVRWIWSGIRSRRKPFWPCNQHSGYPFRLSLAKSRRQAPGLMPISRVNILVKWQFSE